MDDVIRIRKDFNYFVNQIVNSFNVYALGKKHDTISTGKNT